MHDLLVMWNKVRDYVTGLLLVVAAAASLGWYITDLKLDKCVTAREADRATYSAAQKEYEAKAIAEKARIEKEYQDNANKADANYSDLLSKYNASIVRYKAAQGTISRDHLSQPSGASEGSNGPSEGAVIPDDSLILIPLSDAYICADNTARLQAVKEWADSFQK